MEWIEFLRSERLSTAEQLRNLPSVDELLRSEEIAPLRRQCGHRRVTAWTRASIDQLRRRLLAGEQIAAAEFTERLISEVLRRRDLDDAQAIGRVINATGIILHTNLGRSPLARQAIERMHQASRYANVELNLESGRRSERGARVCQLLAQLSGAEDALVVNNCAAATILVLHAIAGGREVIVSRGQLVEIGGGFRLPDVFRAAGVVLREVGTTNRSYLRDYESALCEQTAAIIMVHRSNFAQVGFVTEPSIEELVSIERPEDVPVIDDLGSGCVTDLSACGIDQPTVQESVQSGADLSLFSGDKLFGGPQAGIIVGRKSWIDRLRSSPMLRAMRADKLTLAALEATTEIHLGGSALSDVPILRMIATDSRQILERCERLRQSIEDQFSAEVVACDAQIGGGSVPGVKLASYALKLAIAHPDQLARLLRLGKPAVQGRVTDDSLVLDLRTVADDEIDILSTRLRESIGRMDEAE